MIRLTDRVVIRTTPERVFGWLARMPEEYGRWHPDHVSCRATGGSLTRPGSVVDCKEYLHGKLHTLRLETRSFREDERLDYAIQGLGWGAFSVARVAEGVEFTAEIALGTNIPLVGWIVDAVLRMLFRGRIAAMRVHMREEGENLKRILESERPG